MRTYVRVKNACKDQQQLRSVQAEQAVRTGHMVQRHDKTQRVAVDA
jgi:hypothetical protein